MAVERKLKGINFTGTLKAFRREYGEEAHDNVIASVDGEAGEALASRSVLPSGWYPASWYAALLSAIVAETHGDKQTVRALSRDAVRADFQTLFKIVRLFLSPQKAAQQGMRVSGRYVDGGVVETVDANDGLLHLRMREFYNYSQLMWWDFMGGIEGVLESIGATDIATRVLSGGKDGDHHLEVVLRWRTS